MPSFEEGDLIEIDVEARKLNIIDIHGVKMTEEEVQEVLKQRRLAWKPKERKYQERCTEAV